MRDISPLLEQIRALTDEQAQALADTWPSADPSCRARTHARLLAAGVSDVAFSASQRALAVLRRPHTVRRYTDPATEWVLHHLAQAYAFPELFVGHERDYAQLTSPWTRTVGHLP